MPHVTALEAYYASLRDAALEAAADFRDRASLADRHGRREEGRRLDRAAEHQAALADLTETRRSQAAGWT